MRYWHKECLCESWRESRSDSEILYLISLWDNLDEISSSYVNFFSSLLTFSPSRARISSLRSQGSRSNHGDTQKYPGRYHTVTYSFISLNNTPIRHGTLYLYTVPKSFFMIYTLMIGETIPEGYSIRVHRRPPIIVNIFQIFLRTVAYAINWRTL